MRNGGPVQMWMTLAGIVLVAVGLIGFIDNPLVGSDPNALLPTGLVHNIVHLATGALALYIAFGLRGQNQVNGVIGFGVLYAVILVVVLLSPDLFGLFEVPANAVLHVIHAALAGVSLVVGYMARSNRESYA
ncbi:MAG TPA: DUF4383 domain-containing protein [Vitreimonas sp.]|nr:DUF4383 domain-containing protein [Vitreimonas sp.]